MASGCLQGRRPFYFAFGGGLLPLVWGKVLRVSAVLEGAGLLWGGVSYFREAQSSPGSAKTLPADPEREEGSPARGEPPSARMESTE